MLRPIYSLLRQNTKAVSTFSTFCSKSVATEDKNNHHIGIDFGSRSITVAIMDGNNNPKVIHRHPVAAASVIKGFDVQINIALKYLIGRKFDDPLIQREMKRAPYEIIKAPGGDDAWIASPSGQVICPSSLLQTFLTMMKEEAQSFLGKPVSRAVITYPSMFNSHQLRKTIKAGLGAGLELLHTIDETTAAAFAYGMNMKEEGRIFSVVDLGHRTFDVSILQVTSDGCFNLKGPTNSDVFLGGQDFDIALSDYLISQLKVPDVLRTVFREQKSGMFAFHTMAEMYKEQLTSTCDIPINVSFEAPGLITFHEFIDIVLTRSKFESLVDPLIDKLKNQIESSLSESGIMVKDVDEILLVGGMGNVPKVQEVVSQIFGKSPSRGITNPDEAVALGAVAAVQAGYFGRDAWNDLYR